MFSDDELHQARSVPILELAERHGVKLKKQGAELHGACPVCAGDDRFALLAKNRWHCRGCGVGGDAIKFEMHVNGLPFVDAVRALIGDDAGTPNRRQPTAEEIAAREAREAERRRAEAKERARKENNAARIVAQLQPVAGTPGEAYLRDVRKIDVSHWSIQRALEDVETLGWCERTCFWQPKPAEPFHELHGHWLGAIVGILTDPVTAKPTGGITRTYLHQGRKIGKAKSLAGVEQLGFVRLSPDEEVLGGLHIAEGLETALSGMSDPRMNFCPMWAAGSTVQLAKLPVLDGVECLTILADNDENQASVDAASTTYWRWKDAGREVHIRQPKERGDLNDIARRAR
jgi:hypothetical protein